VARKRIQLLSVIRGLSDRWILHQSKEIHVHACSNGHSAKLLQQNKSTVSFIICYKKSFTTSE